MEQDERDCDLLSARVGHLETVTAELLAALKEIVAAKASAASVKGLQWLARDAIARTKGGTR
jgi:hypothetical protein